MCFISSQIRPRRMANHIVLSTLSAPAATTAQVETVVLPEAHGPVVINRTPQ